MTSTYSPSLRLELMATGDQSGTWGMTTNTNLGTLLEQAITGYLSVAQSDVANLTLTALNGASDQSRNMVLNITGAMTANRNVVVPTAAKIYLVKNSTTGGFNVTFKTAAGTGVSVPPTVGQWVYCDGTNVVDMGADIARSGIFFGTNDSLTYDDTTNTWSFNADGAQGSGNVGVATVNLGDNGSGLYAASLTTSGSTVVVSSGLTTGGATTIGGNALPSADASYALGSISRRWNNLFLSATGKLNFGNDDSISYDDTTNTWSFNADGAQGSGSVSAANILLGDNGSGFYAATVTTSGSNVVFSGGISVQGGQVVFPATQNLSSNANTLDDYEEGTFSPTVQFGGAATGVAYTTQAGFYTKIGNTVAFSLRVTLSAKGSSTGTFTVEGLPFTTGNRAAFATGLVANFTGLTGAVQLYAAGSSTSISVRQSTATGNAVLTDTSITNTSDITITGTYFV